jgi:F0F1-type ATP synthase alpha subunit
MMTLTNYGVYIAISQKRSTVARLVQILEEHDAMKYSIVVAALLPPRLLPLYVAN